MRTFTSNWREWVKIGLLLGMGIYFVFLLTTGTLNNYINQRFQWLSYVAAAIFLALGIWRVWVMLRTDDKHKHDHDHDHHHDHDHDHDHSHGLSWITMLIVATPLILAVTVPSQPLGADAVTGNISLNPVGGVSALRVPPEQRNILDWLREFSGSAPLDSYEGQPVDVIGFVYREPDMSDESFMVARYTMSCCVADAFAIGMPVQMADATSLETGTWVRIQGTLSIGMFRGERVGIIQPEVVEPVDVPETPYLYA